MILMTLDTEKAFDSVNHLFLFTAIEKYGFNEDFIKWIHILIQNLESCVINGGTMKFIMQSENFNGFNIFEKVYLYTSFADDTTFFLKD